MAASAGENFEHLGAVCVVALVPDQLLHLLEIEGGEPGHQRSGLQMVEV